MIQIVKLGVRHLEPWNYLESISTDDGKEADDENDLSDDGVLSVDSLNCRLTPISEIDEFNNLHETIDDNIDFMFPTDEEIERDFNDFVSVFCQKH